MAKELTAEIQSLVATGQLDPEVAQQILTNLALLYHSQERYHEAELLFQQAAAIEISSSLNHQ